MSLVFIFHLYFTHTIYPSWVIIASDGNNNPISGQYGPSGDTSYHVGIGWYYMEFRRHKDRRRTTLERGGILAAAIHVPSTTNEISSSLSNHLHPMHIKILQKESDTWGLASILSGKRRHDRELELFLASS